MKILAVHGLGRQEHNAQSWQPGWRQAFTDVVGRWDASQVVDVEFATYDDFFGDTPMKVGDTLEGFGRLLWDEVKYSIADTVGGWLGGLRRREFGADVRDKVSETLKWRIGMVTQFAEDEKLREKLRATLTAQINAFQPDIVFAHSLGTLLTYDLFLHPPDNQIIANRTYITCGCQIGRAALRSLFGGRLEMVAAKQWYNLYNRHDDVLVVPLKIYSDRYQQVDTEFEMEGVGDHDAAQYIRHPDAQNKVWRELVKLPRARSLRVDGKLEKTDLDLGERKFTASVVSRQKRRAVLVGINDYPNSEDRLEGCVNDVFRMSATLQQIGFEPDEIRIVLNERATASAIRERFSWLLEDARPGDERVFFYSGHGAQIPDYDSDDVVDHTDETLVAYDFNWDDRSTHLTDDDFNQLYSQLPYGTVFVAFLDCCHSGGMTRAGGSKVRGLNPPDDIRHRMLKWNRANELWEPRDLAAGRGLPKELRDNVAYTGNSGASNRLLRGVALRELAHDKKTSDMRKAEHGHNGPYLPLIFEACAESEYAFEYRDGVTSYGAYTYFLTKTLFDAGHAKRKLTFEDLSKEVKGLIGQYYQQTPQLVGPTAWLGAVVPWQAPPPKKAATSRRKPKK